MEAKLAKNIKVAKFDTKEQGKIAKVSKRSNKNSTKKADHEIFAKKIRKLLRDSGLSSTDKLKILAEETRYILRDRVVSAVRPTEIAIATLDESTEWRWKEGKFYPEEQPDGSYIIWKCVNGQLKLCGPA